MKTEEVGVFEGEIILVDVFGVIKIEGFEVVFVLVGPKVVGAVVV